MPRASCVLILFSILIFGCKVTEKSIKQALLPVEVQVIQYHVQEYNRSLEEFTRRLYLKNPKYEKDIEMRKRKVHGIFHGEALHPSDYNNLPSHRILEAAFGKNPSYEDRVFLLGLGLAKSIREAYDTKDMILLSAMQIPLEKLEKLYHNISHVNWRLKVYRDENGKLLFLTNEAGENGYINMGYEVIMTEILTRIKDDIYLRGGAPPKLIFNMSSLFLPLILL